MNDHQLVYLSASSLIHIRTLRNPSGSLCEPRELIKFRLDDEVARYAGRVVYAQITHDGDLLLNLRNKRISMPGKQTEVNLPLITDDHLLKISVSQVKSNANVLRDKYGDQYLPVDQDDVMFDLSFPDQVICRPAVSQSGVYFLQSQSFESNRGQLRFVGVSISDGSPLFSVTVPCIAEAGQIFNNGKQFRAVGKQEKQNSTPGPNMYIQDRDISLFLTNDQQFCIWSGFENRIYIFCTRTGSLLYIQDREAVATPQIRQSTNHSGFWLTKEGPAAKGPYTIESLFCCTNMHDDSKVLRPLYYGEFGKVLDANIPVAVDIAEYALYFNQNLAGTVEWEPQQRNPFCAMTISPLIVKEYHAQDLPTWMRQDVLPDLHPSILETEKTFKILEPLTTPRYVSLPPRGSQEFRRRWLEFERPVGHVEEFYELQAGYVTGWMPNDQQLLIVDFWPVW